MKNTFTVFAQTSTALAKRVEVYRLELLKKGLSFKVRSSGQNKYLPHQGQRERARRLKVSHGLS